MPKKVVHYNYGDSPLCDSSAKGPLSLSDYEGHVTCVKCLDRFNRGEDLSGTMPTSCAGPDREIVIGAIAHRSPEAGKMERFHADLNVVFTKVRDALDHWGLKGWDEYLIVRQADKPESFVVLAHPKDGSDFADRLVALHKGSERESELAANAAEHERLMGELNLILNPMDGPTAPATCDLVAYAAELQSDYQNALLAIGHLLTCDVCRGLRGDSVESCEGRQIIDRKCCDDL